MSTWPAFQKEVAQALANFLSRTLPEIGGKNWWKFYVLDQLNLEQARRLQKSPHGRLGRLDFAALVKVALASCDEMTAKQRAPRELKNSLKTMKAIRNLHSHAPADGIPIAKEIHDLRESADFVALLDNSSPLPEQLRAEANRLAQQPASPTTPITVPVRSAKNTLIRLPKPTPTSQANSLSQKTYVGMDFGTSTTVLSAVTERDGVEKIDSLVIEQPDENGVTTRSDLVHTVIAYVKERLIFGREASRHRLFLHEGHKVFSSFKMRLGVEIGPTYPETALGEGVLKSGYKIESAQDAAAMFFRFTKWGVEKALKSAKVPEITAWCVSVPASFEANQRRDLETALRSAGISDDCVTLIDEPNAALLSYLFESSHHLNDSGLLDLLRQHPVNVMVYDFGAGTCDISVLRLESRPNGIESRNLALSRFTALGGNDIDLALARRTLLPQLIQASGPKELTQRDIDEQILPRLQPTAELLKIGILRHASNKGIKTTEELRHATELRFTEADIGRFEVGVNKFHLPGPNAALSDLADALEPFTTISVSNDQRTQHVFAPVQDALEKSGLTADDLDAVLFIGGSSENIIVRHTVMSALGGSVEAFVPRDLRSHVSKGAALHSYWYNGCEFDFIQPITSEPILALVRGGTLETIFPAATPLPSHTNRVDELIVDDDGQKRIEIPICVSTADKLLGVIVIKAPERKGFRRGTKIMLSAQISRDKLLHVEARVGNVVVKTEILNPLANRPLSNSETRLLTAKQNFNRVLLEHGSRPPVEYVIAYANAAQAAEDHHLAAEMFQKVEQLDQSRNFAIPITYNYHRAGKKSLAEKWASRAYDRERSAVSAYNLALYVTDKAEKEALLREALGYRPDYCSAISVLGQLLLDSGDPEGTKLLARLSERLTKSLRSHSIDEGNSRGARTCRPESWTYRYCFGG